MTHSAIRAVPTRLRHSCLSIMDSLVISLSPSPSFAPKFRCQTGRSVRGWKLAFRLSLAIPLCLSFSLSLSRLRAHASPCVCQVDLWVLVCVCAYVCASRSLGYVPLSCLCYVLAIPFLRSPCTRCSLLRSSRCLSPALTHVVSVSLHQIPMQFWSRRESVRDGGGEDGKGAEKERRERIS